MMAGYTRIDGMSIGSGVGDTWAGDSAYDFSGIPVPYDEVSYLPDGTQLVHSRDGRTQITRRLADGSLERVDFPASDIKGYRYYIQEHLAKKIELHKAVMDGKHKIDAKAKLRKELKDYLYSIVETMDLDGDIIKYIHIENIEAILNKAEELM